MSTRFLEPLKPLKVGLSLTKPLLFFEMFKRFFAVLNILELKFFGAINAKGKLINNLMGTYLFRHYYIQAEGNFKIINQSINYKNPWIPICFFFNLQVLSVITNINLQEDIKLTRGKPPNFYNHLSFRITYRKIEQRYTLE